MQATISAIILAKNEEKNIISCINSLSWCDEIFVIDDYSTDKTVELAKKHKATIYTHKLDSNFSQQRNFALEKANGEWVLFVDADERVTLPLHYEILNTITNGMEPYVAYYLKRVDTLWGKKMKYGESGKTELVRLARKSSGKWIGTVHETWDIKGKIGKLQNTLDHFPHQTMTEFLGEVNKYTDLRADELYEKKVKASIFMIICYPMGKFFQNYILKRGFLDGIRGLISALMMSFHSFLVRGKLWLLWSKKDIQIT